MLLKLLLTLVPMLFFSDGAGAGGDGGDGDGDTGGTDKAASHGGGGNDGNEAPKGPSANKMIKDFAASRGVTVEQLLENYEKRENADKTVTEKLTGERDKFKTAAEQYRSELMRERARGSVMDAAKDAGAVSAKAVYASISSGIDYDDDGNPTNVDTLITKLQKDDPDLFGKVVRGSGDGGRGGDGAVPDMNAYIRRASGHG